MVPTDDIRGNRVEVGQGVSQNPAPPTPELAPFQGVAVDDAAACQSETKLLLGSRSLLALDEPVNAPHGRVFDGPGGPLISKLRVLAAHRADPAGASHNSHLTGWGERAFDELREAIYASRAVAALVSMDEAESRVVSRSAPPGAFCFRIEVMTSRGCQALGAASFPCFPRG